MRSRYDFIIFDLDGTLVDSALLCAAIVNEMLRERGSKRRLTVDNVKPYMSRGGTHLVSGLLASECGDPAAEIALFRKRYAELPTPENSLFQGVRTGLSRIRSLGFKLAICSNKPQNLCEKVLSDLDLLASFDVVVGGGPDRKPKPHPQLMEMTLDALGANAKRALFVGDSEQDEGIAKAAGVDFCVVSYGYPEPEWQPDDVLEFHRFKDLVSALALECMAGRGSSRVA